MNRGIALARFFLAAALFALVILAQKPAPPGLRQETVSAPELLHQAALRGKTATIEMLLKLGADPNRADKNGRTALHDACLKGNVAAARLLLDGAAKVGARDAQAATPLHDAALSGSRLTIELLLARNAETDARDSEGQTPLDYALKLDRTDAVRALRSVHNPQ